VFAGLTMVSSFKFYSGKDINLRKSVPFSVVVGITFGVVAVFMLSSNLPEMLFILSLAYACSGYVMWVYQMLSRRSAGMKPPLPPAPPEH
jgi:CDP-diacylglycerol--serine O-phosphatidyltransferase